MNTQANSFPCKICGEVYTEESGASEGWICEECQRGTSDYNELRRHIGHSIVCVCYGKDGKDPENVAIECETCGEVLLDYDKPLWQK